MAPDSEDPDFRERIRSSFAKQGLMSTLKTTLGNVSPGLVEIAIRPDPSISQQHGLVHAGAVSAIADSAAGYAALSLMPADTGVLTTECKINLVAPAAGERIVARGRVVKVGRTLTVAQTEVFAESDGRTRFVWVADVLPNEIAPYMDAQMDLGLLAMQKALGRSAA